MTVVVMKLKFFVLNMVIHETLVSEKMLNKPNKWLKLKEKHLHRSKKHHDGLREPIDDVNKRLVVKQTNSKATASISDLLFARKGV